MSAVEMSDGGRQGSDFNPEDSDIPMIESNTETESVSLPPKKKKQLAQKETTQKETTQKETAQKETTQKETAQKERVKKEKVPKPKV